MTRGPLRRGPSGDFLEGVDANDVPLWDPVAKEWSTGPIPGGGGGVPLSNVLWVDIGTSVAPADQTGAIGAPFDTIQAALDALGTNVTILICPGDYSAESLAIGTNVRVQLQGVSRPGPGTAFGANNVLLGDIQMTSGGEQGALTFVNVQFAGAQAFCGTVQCVDCIDVNVSPGTGGFAALEIVDGWFQGAECGSLTIWGGGTIVGPAPATVTIHEGTTVSIQGANLIGSAMAVEFIDDPGVVSYDLFTESTGPNPPFTITNGTATRFALPIQDITASLADQQAQIDNIVLAGVTLRLWTDNRVA